MSPVVGRSSGHRAVSAFGSLGAVTEQGLTEAADLKAAAGAG
ncbi:hypothetical protein [Actinoplanes lobatus]|uniref:Uncharacterized protein n=1 Tax=Actinoplanes lobatus TaxID=113568 RepID=A0A7W7MJA8_9ACTN|nr:hypothetical protein [Actinoplanes lobatus]MBB4751860.1 hypothetical protein [Actinoplanes lobatus]